MVTANFRDSYIDIEREHRTLQRLLRNGNHDLQVLPAAEIIDLQQALAANKKSRGVDILHFSGHATLEDGLHLRDHGRGRDFLDAAPLKNLLSDSGVKLLLLNACHSELLVTALSEVLPAVIGTTRAVRDVAARQFTRDFYEAITGKSTIRTAFETALKKQKPAASPAYTSAGEGLDCVIE